MKKFRLFFVMVLAAVAWPGLVSSEWGTAQEKEGATEPPEGPLPPKTQGKITLALDPGFHTAVITQALFTPAGKQLITGCIDNSIRIWDVSTGQLRRVLRVPLAGGTGGLNRLALSLDGQTLAVAAHPGGEETNQVIYLVGFADGHVQRVLKGHTDRIRALAFSRDGRLLASGGNDHTLRIWNLAGTEPGPVFKSDSPVKGLSFSPDGHRLVRALDDGSCDLIDPTGEKVALQLKGAVIPPGYVLDPVAWSPDGTTVATCDVDGLRLWGPDGQQRRHLLPKTELGSVAFSADSRRVLATLYPKNTGHRAFILDVRTGKEELVFTPKGPFPDPKKVVNGVFSPDGLLAATVGGGEGAHEIFLWKTSDGTVLRRWAGPTWLSGSDSQAAWSADGKTVSWRKVADSPSWTGGPTTFNLEELRLGPPLTGSQPPGEVLQQGPLSLQPFDKNTVQVFKSGKPIAGLTMPRNWSVGKTITFVGKDRVALMVKGGYPVCLFDPGTGKVLSLWWHPGTVWSIAPSPDGRYLLTLCEDQILRIWAPKREQPLMFLYVSGADWIAWTPEGYYAASPGGEKLMGWVVDNGLDQMATFHPAQRFKKLLYRPDVIKLVLEKGSVEEALKAAGGEAQDVEKILPPKASLRVLQQDGTKADVEVVAEAGSPGQPVAELRLLVDGRPAKLEGDKPPVQKIDPPLEKDARAKWTVLLDPGAHKLSVVAYAKDAYSISDEVPIEMKSSTPPPSSNKHGTLCYVGIGVNQLQYLPNLNLTGAVPDVHAMQKCLMSACADRFEKIEAATLCDQEATRAAILKKLADLQAQVQPADVVIVHFSCHGEVGEDGGLYLICHDAKLEDLKGTAVSGQELRDQLGQYTCPVLLLLDACHSGKFPLRSPTDGLSRLLADDSCGVAVMTAALAHQTAEDRAEGGVFTEGIVKGLSGGAPLDGVSKRLYVHNLFGYVYSFVTQETSNRQMPVYLPSGSVPPIVLKE